MKYCKTLTLLLIIYDGTILYYYYYYHYFPPPPLPSLVGIPTSGEEKRRTHAREEETHTHADVV